MNLTPRTKDFYNNPYAINHVTSLCHLIYYHYSRKSHATSKLNITQAVTFLIYMGIDVVPCHASLNKVTPGTFKQSFAAHLLKSGNI